MKNKARVPSLPDRSPFPAAVAMGFLALVIYTFTLRTGVPGGDSGELILASRFLGIAHPPGFPLYTLIAHAFSWLPFGSLAWRINLFSAFCDAAAAALLFLSVHRICRNGWAAALAAGLFAFSPLIWGYAVAAEVFPLNNLFVAGLFYLLALFFESDQAERKTKIALILSFWMGLALSNHHAFALYAMPSAVLILVDQRKVLLRPGVLVRLVLCFLAGLLPYLYLPLAGPRVALVSWGDFSSWDGFLTFVLRREYGTFNLSSPGGSPGAHSSTGDPLHWIGIYLRHLPGEMLSVGALASLVGVRAAWRTRKALTIVLLGSFFVYLAVFARLSNLGLNAPLYVGIQARFWQQLDLVLYLFAGLGFAVLSDRTLRRVSPWVQPVFVTTCILLQMILHFPPSSDSRDNHVFEDFGKKVFGALPQGTLLLSSGDHITHTLQYLQTIEGIRPDIRILNSVALIHPWYVPIARKHLPGVVFPGSHHDPHKQGTGFNLLEFLDANFEKFPIYVVNELRVPDSSHKTRYRVMPIGMVEQIRLKTDPVSVEDWHKTSEKAFEPFRVPELARFPAESWEHEVLRQYWEMRQIFAAELIIYGMERNEGPEAFRAAKLGVEILKDVISDQTYVPANVYRNLGVAYQFLSTSDPSARGEMVLALQRFLELADPADPVIPKVRDVLLRERQIR